MKQQKQYEHSSYGKGKFRFVLGHGSCGVFGHVELTLQTLPTPGQFAVQWRVDSGMHDSDAREHVQRAASEYLRKYIAGHPEYGFVATITEVISDPDRRNDYDRSTSIALRFALEDMGLPVPQIFGP